MRLTGDEQRVISESIEFHDADAEVYLFGSRVDDAARGGDIDLLVISKKIDLMAKLDILADLHERFGARKIDLVVFPDLSRPFARIAVNQGLRL